MEFRNEEEIRADDISGWGESLLNCIEGSNYLKGREYLQLAQAIDCLARERGLLRVALSQIVEVEEGPGETDRPHMVHAREVLKQIA